MKLVLDVLSPDERVQFEQSLDEATAPTAEVRDRVRETRSFLSRCVYFTLEAEQRWGRTEVRARQRILSELIWRASCVVAKSETAVIGLRKFTLGHEFSVAHEERDGADVFVVR